MTFKYYLQPRKRKIQWKEIIIVTTIEEARQFIDSLNDMSRRVLKADYELYYCKFSRTSYPDCSIKAKIENYGSTYKAYSFGYHEHEESIELTNTLSCEKKRLCFEILSSNPYTLPRKVFDKITSQNSLWMNLFANWIVYDKRLIQGIIRAILHTHYSSILVNNL